MAIHVYTGLLLGYDKWNRVSFWKLQSTSTSVAEVFTLWFCHKSQGYLKAYEVNIRRSINQVHDFIKLVYRKFLALCNIEIVFMSFPVILTPEE